MNPLARILREPALILGLATAAIGLAIAFGVHITDDQTSALMIFLGALITLLRFLVIPASEVVAQQRAGEPVKAGAKAENDWGITKGQVVAVQPVLPGAPQEPAPALPPPTLPDPDAMN